MTSEEAYWAGLRPEDFYDDLLEPDATERARAFFTKQGKWDFAERFDGWRCCELMAAFLESETPRIKAPLEAENALLKRKLEIALRFIKEMQQNSFHVRADEVKAEIEEVK